VPGEHSTGGKQQLTGTSRRGNKYLRKLFVLGAHTVVRRQLFIPVDDNYFSL
jgi:transposase